MALTEGKPSQSDAIMPKNYAIIDDVPEKGVKDFNFCFWFT